MKKFFWTVIILATAAVLTACGGSDSKTITVASKDFTEQFILGEMYAAGRCWLYC